MKNITIPEYLKIYGLKEDINPMKNNLEETWKEEFEEYYFEKINKPSKYVTKEDIAEGSYQYKDMLLSYFAAKKSDFEEIKNLKEQLAEAESVLGYYGNSESYYIEYRGDHLCRNVICKDDISSIEKIRDPHNGRIAIKYCGGKRARQYFAEKEKQDKVKVSSNESN